jgi:chromosomal replication initiator protein
MSAVSIASSASSTPRQPGHPGDGARSRLWAGVLDALARHPAISRASYATWLANTQLIAQHGRVFVVEAQHSFARDKLDRAFGEPVREAIAQAAGVANAEVRFVVPGQAPLQPATPPESRVGPALVAAAGAGHDVPSALPAAAGAGATRPAGAPEAAAPLPWRVPAPALHPRFTFASFVAGKESQFALAAARAVAENPVLAYNPLFLYGASGSGKTHLLHAIGQHTLALRPRARVSYVPARALLNDLAATSGRAGRAAVLAAYASADLLLLDEAQEIAGCVVQKEVLHLVSALVEGEKQVVAAADRPPRAVAGLDERLRALLQMGLVAGLALPELESRLAILRAKAEARGVSLPAAALEHVARRVSGSVRELESALDRVLAAAGLARASLAPDGLAALAGVAVASPRPRPTAQQVQQAVALAFGVPAEALLAKRRDREVALARQAAMYLLREETGASLAEIGAALGGRDHTTVLHGCEKIAAALPHDARLREHVAAARHLLAGVAGVVAPAAAATISRASAAAP